MDRYFYIEPDHFGQNGIFFFFISDLDDNLLKLIDAIKRRNEGCFRTRDRFKGRVVRVV